MAFEFGVLVILHLCAHVSLLTFQGREVGIVLWGQSLSFVLGAFPVAGTSALGATPAHATATTIVFPLKS